MVPGFALDGVQVALWPDEWVLFFQVTRGFMVKFYIGTNKFKTWIGLRPIPYLQIGDPGPRVDHPFGIPSGSFRGDLIDYALLSCAGHAFCTTPLHAFSF